MSSDRIGGRYEPEHRKVGGPGVRCNGKCDECSRDTTARRKAKVPAVLLRVTELSGVERRTEIKPRRLVRAGS